MKNKSVHSPTSKSSSSRLSPAALIKGFLIFCAGLLLGLTLFFPKHIIWENLFNRLHVQELNIISSYNLDEAGLFSARLLDVRLNIAGEKFVLPRVSLSLGFSPLANITVDSGPELQIALKRGPVIKSTGAINLATIFIDRELSGHVWFDIDMLVSKETWLPVQGSISAGSKQGINIDSDPVLTSFDLDAKLHEARLEIAKLEGTGPVDFSLAGNVALNYDNLQASVYLVQGSYTLAGQTTPFRQQGRLSEFLMQ
ncbi:hypothetical protein [Desulfonatronovibrio magnus]|uniref:hypothetical protein n=1 Tax=Desulfonatronovibrio magnus TaxID=698827 RepID=UPI0012FB236A|nr:hypothetical protein [Desulfonatronovibrio magnus]